MASKALFEVHDKAGKQQGKEQVGKGYVGVSLEVVEMFRRILIPHAQDVGNGQHGNQAGIFQHAQGLVADGGEDGTHCLGEDNLKQGLARGHAQVARGFSLFFRDGLDSGAEHIGHVGAVTKTKPGHSRGQGGDVKKLSQGVVDVKQQDQKRNPAQYLGVERREDLYRPDWRQLAQAYKKPHQNRGGAPHQGNPQGVGDPRGQEFQQGQVVGFPQGQVNQKKQTQRYRQVPGPLSCLVPRGVECGRLFFSRVLIVHE